MQTSQWEVIILKPTRVFLSFLASQLPDTELPELKTLQTDCTAYVMRKQPDDEATLDELERHFSKMFHHEISRWLGPDAHNAIETSFLDFLCCFKFEMHNHQVLMERSIQEAKQLICIKPRSVLLKWMRSAVGDHYELTQILDQVHVSRLAENSTVVLKSFAKLADIKPFLNQFYKTLFDAEMSRMCGEPDEWPMVNSFETFSRYFAVEIHTQLIHLS